MRFGCAREETPELTPALICCAHSIDTVGLSTRHHPDQSKTQAKMKPSFAKSIIDG